LPKVSIVIPCSRVKAHTLQCIEACKRLDYPDYEILLLPDEPLPEMLNGVKVIPTGRVTPGRKRNIGVDVAKGEVIAFIDDDAYPRKDWLKNAVNYLKNEDVVAVGGPGLTPEEDDDMRKASGYILSSLSFGFLRSRFEGEKVRESDDIHSCNFIVKKEVLDTVRWDEKYWPGEDTLMSLEISRSGLKMLEAPDVVVYHHRKPLFIEHLRQIARFGMHRGFFAKRYPENSRRLVYFMPSLLVLAMVAGIALSLFEEPFYPYLLAFFSIYFIGTFLMALKARRAKLVMLTWIGIILTHITYGIFFLIGLIKRDLRS